MDTSKTCYLFFDFDGTVTTDVTVKLVDGSEVKRRILPESHLNSLKALHDAGHKIFLCTGRSRGSMLGVDDEWRVALALPWDGMIFGANDMWYMGKRISVTYIEREEYLPWMDYCKETGRLFSYNGTEKIVQCDFRNKMTDDEIENAYQNIAGQFPSNLMTNLSIVPRVSVQDMPNSDLTVINLATYADIFPPNCNKGSAIIRFCELIGAPTEQTCCFGDSENDIDMFKVCSERVAMKKAPESLKALATYSAVTDYGVTEAISHIFKI